MIEYQVELKVDGEGGLFNYVVSQKREDWAIQDAVQMLLRDFPIFNGREISTYKVFPLEPKNKQIVLFQTESQIEQLKEDASNHYMNIQQYILWLIEKEREQNGQ